MFVRFVLWKNPLLKEQEPGLFVPKNTEFRGHPEIRIESGDGVDEAGAFYEVWRPPLPLQPLLTG